MNKKYKTMTLIIMTASAFVHAAISEETDPVARLTENLTNTISVHSLKSMPEEAKIATVSQVRNMLSDKTPAILSRLTPSEDIIEFVDQVSVLMEEVGAAFPRQIDLQFMKNGMEALVELNAEVRKSRISSTQIAIQDALSSKQPVRDISYVDHVLCARWGFVGSSL